MAEVPDRRVEDRVVPASCCWLMLTNDQESLTLAALQSYDDAGWPAPLLLLDNGTGRDSESVRERFAHRLGQDLRIFGEGSNFGVSAGRNYLAQRATSDWLVFVDNDVLFTEETAGFVQELGRSDADIVLPIVLDRDGRVHGAGGTYGRWLSWSRNGYFGADVETARRHLDGNTDWGGGCCLSLRRSAFEALRGFDAGQHGLYGAEDLDFCLRARKAGATSARSAAAPVIHLDAGTGSDPVQKYPVMRASAARVRVAHGVWITRYPSAWFWHLRQAPELEPPRRLLRSSFRRLRHAMTRRGSGTSPASGTLPLDGRADRDNRTRVLAWGALPPPVHGSSVMNLAVLDVMGRTGDVRWVNASTSDQSEIERVSLRKVLVTVTRMADYSWHSVRWAGKHLSYVSSATLGPALYRDLVIWTISVVTSRRVVIHLHRGQLAGLTPAGALAPLQRWLIRRSELWVLGSVVAAPVRSSGARLVHVVHNGVTCESRHHGEGRRTAEATAAERSAPASGANTADVRVVFLSNHFRAKGTDLAAEVAETLADEPFAWTFAGGAVQPDTEALLRPLGRLGSRYRRIEAVDEDVRCRLLHGSDVLLLPSRDEGSPLVVLEAMEHGVIPVVSARGCMPEVVGEVGAVCDTVEEFAEVLRLLAKDRGELAERSAEALLRWRAQYSRDAFEHRVAELLAGAAGAGSDEDGDRP